MKIGGFLKKSLIEYPGCISAVVFTIGCNFRCPFCHNPELVLQAEASFTEAEIFAYLDLNRKWLDALVISGGEPTLQPDLADFCLEIRKMGFPVKIETNGTRPEILSSLISEKLIQRIQMDIKTRLDQPEYSRITDAAIELDQIRKSIEIIKKSGLPFEFVTTTVPGIHNARDIAEIRRELSHDIPHRLQEFRPGKVLNEKLLLELGYVKEVIGKR
ncbi:MAG: anaerobic ribonucleoside-triphosphate reductase activating protein [Candidatus Wallbacteria bacterium]|nr:anaerobic ribonucleoside-triphosphate reductase activating protein [Candidatus Wallbacteria bacterium]